MIKSWIYYTRDFHRNNDGQTSNRDPVQAYIHPLFVYGHV